jgi:photosystem II stability/assembly factor-like uncharacterized protein
MVLLIASIFLWFPGCSTTAENRENSSPPSLRSSDEPPPLQSSASSEEILLQFEAIPNQAPRLFSDGSLVDEQHAWVAADFTDLWRTTDGGNIWQRMRRGNKEAAIIGDIFRVYFITPSRGWLMTGDGTWQTEDGGSMWRRIFPYDSNGPQFADAQNGWMNVSVTESSQQSYVTQDGGQTWHACGRRHGYNTQQPGRHAYFLKPKLGWAITSRSKGNQSIAGVAQTNDGGCNWKVLWTSEENPDETYYDIYFLNEREGWLAGIANGGLYQTTDGGRTWEDVLLPTEKIHVSHVYFTSSREGWIIARPMNTGDAEGFFHTIDGGQEWKQLSDIEIPSTWKAGKLFQMLYYGTHRQ